MAFVRTQPTGISRASFGTDLPGPRGSEQLAMFCVTAESCRRFSLAILVWRLRTWKLSRGIRGPRPICDCGNAKRISLC